MGGEGCANPGTPQDVSIQSYIKGWEQNEDEVMEMQQNQDSFHLDEVLFRNSYYVCIMVRYNWDKEFHGSPVGEPFPGDTIEKE